MGTKGMELLESKGKKIPELIKLLRKAFSEAIKEDINVIFK